ncbi:MAG: type 4a pilus biogenesis protein PilO [Deltaproteobacteria bacterium]|nr:type 4a pilus biogenesis protein PilO [Deltaproteobacteria bacterium]
MGDFLEKFAKTPPLQKILGLLLLSGLLVMMYYFMVFDQQRTTQKRLRARLGTLNQELEEKKQIAQNLVKYRREVERLDQQLKESLALLPKKSEIPSLLQKISNLAEKSGLTIDLFEPMAEQIVGFYAKVPVSINLQGSYPEIAVFFDKVAKLSRIVNIGDIKLKDPSDKSGKIVLKASCVATTFRFVEPKEARGGKGKKKRRRQH